MREQDVNKIRKTIEYITNTTIAKGKNPKMWSAEIIDYNGLTKQAKVRIAGDPADNTHIFLNISGHNLRIGDLAYLTSFDGTLTNAYISASREANDTYGNYVEFRYKRSESQPSSPPGDIPLNDVVYSSAFSPDGSILVMGGSFSGHAKIYSVNGTILTYVDDIYADSGTTPLNDDVFIVSFSPDGNTLVLGGRFSGRAKVYSVSGTTITYVSDIYIGTIAFNSVVNTASFSPDGNTLVVGGLFSGNAKVYSVSGTTITYVSDIYADSGTTPLNGDAFIVSFSPDGNTLVLGGWWFSGFAKVYSVSGTTITYVGNIYADSGTTLLDDYALTASFSPDGSTLVLGGNFSGRAKVYSVSGTTITYVDDIYADNSSTALSSAALASVFSPDGNTLVVGGWFTGRGKIYSVSGTTITYVSDIYADSGTTVLNGDGNTSQFSPNGNTFLLGGTFTGYAKIYSVNGTIATYAGDIYASTGNSPVGWFVDPPEGTDSLWMIQVLKTPIGLIAEGESWSTPVKFQGEDGNYVEFRYNRAATQPATPTGDDPAGWTTTIPSGTDTLWMSQVLKNTDGEIVGSATWSTPVQFDAEDGADGPPGPGVVYQGNFSAGSTYYYTSYRRDVVSYSGVYYLYNVSTTSSGNVVSSWNISEWEEFSDTFRSVATALLLAEDATILNTLVMGYDVGVGSGLIRSASKDSYGSSSAGFWLGYDGATPKFDIGNNSEYLRWDGSGLSIRTDDFNLFGSNGSLLWDGSVLSITGYLGSDGASRIELNDGNISTYVSNVLRMKLDYNSLDFYRAGSQVGFMESRYVGEFFAGSVLGDCLYIEAAGNAIAFNSNNLETDVALIVYPSWIWAPRAMIDEDIMFGLNGVHSTGYDPHDGVGDTETPSWYFEAPNSLGVPIRFMEYYAADTEVVARENWDFSEATVTGLEAVAVFG